MTHTSRLLLSGATTFLALSLAAGGAIAQVKKEVCPVTKEPLGGMGKPIALQVNDTTVKFCCGGCPAKYKAEPAKYTSTLKDPVTHKPFKVMASSPKEERAGALYVFSTAKTKSEFDAHPDKYAKKKS
jgi:YHS domain-containing protein